MSDLGRQSNKMSMVKHSGIRSRSYITLGVHTCNLKRATVNDDEDEKRSRGLLVQKMLQDYLEIRKSYVNLLPFRMLIMNP